MPHLKLIFVETRQQDSHTTLPDTMRVWIPWPLTHVDIREITLNAFSWSTEVWAHKYALCSWLHSDLPALMRTRLMYFSPRKFLISTRDPLSWITTLMGKWAYTERILYRNPCSRTNTGLTFLRWQTLYNSHQPLWLTKEECLLSTSMLKVTYQGHSLDHVLDMAANGTHRGQLLPVTPPFVHTELNTSRGIVTHQHGFMELHKLLVYVREACNHIL